MIIIGDVHGCYYTLIALLMQIDRKKDEKICFVGDLIDRGPKSKEVIDFVKSNNHLCVKGNHEDMAVKSLNDEFCDLGDCKFEYVWANNGGNQTIHSFGSYKLMKAGYYNWMKDLPIMLKFPEIKINDKSLIVTHSFLFSNKEDYEWGIMWDRNFHIDDEIWGKDPKYFNVFGHTPVKVPVFKDCYALIDTGCVYNYHKNEHNNYGNLTAIRVLDGMKDRDIEVYNQTNCEE